MANPWDSDPVVAPFDLKGALSQTDKMLGLPDGFSAAQIKVESGGDPNAVSPKGAMGLAQVIPDTLKAVSQRLGRNLDPMNPADAVLIHREVMRENLQKFGTPDKALMAYNGGWDPARWNNPETQGYVQKVSAALKGEGQNPLMAAAGRAVNAVMPSAQAASAQPWANDPVVARPSAAQQVENDPITQGARNFTDDMGPVGRFVAGYGKAGADLVRGAGQLVGLESRADVAESRRLDAPLMATTGGKVGNVTGNVAALAPVAMVPGANTIAGGAGIGALTGLLEPSTSTGETLKNVAAAAVGGGAVPTLVKALRTARAAAEPFYEAGKNAIVGRALNQAAGKDAPAVAQRLQDASAPFVGPSNTTPPRTTMGELVPGSFPTVGQASGNAGVASLESAATATNPAVTNAMSDIVKAQNGARVGALNDMAGTDGRRDFTAAARDATANQLYGEARKLGIDPSVLTPEVVQNISTFAQRVPTSILDKAKLLAKINNDPMTDASSIKGLHWVKLAIDDEIGAATRSGNDTLKAAYTGLQKDLLTGMDNLSPAYANARQTYSAMSKPVNQMDVAGDIIDKSVDKLHNKLQPQSFAKAVQSDATAARATGFPGATMEGTMEPAQLNALDMILQDVKRADQTTRDARGIGSDTVKKLAYGNILDQSGVPTFLRNFSPLQVAGNLVSRGADAAYGRANRELSNRLAEVMLDPGEAATLMTQATPRELNQLLRLLQRTGSGLSIAAPTAVNSLQQSQ